MKLFAVARKSLLEWLREPQLMLLVIFAPLAFALATIVSYPRPFLATHPLLVVNTAPGGAALLAEIAALRYPNGQPAFELRAIPSPAEGEAALQDHSATALLVIAPGPALAPGAPAFSAALRGDALYPRFYDASALLDPVIRRHANRLAGQPDAIVWQPVASSRTALPGGPQNEYDLYLPGMIVFAILLLTPQTAMLVGRETRSGALQRLRLAPLSSLQLFGGITLAQLLVAALLVAVVLGGSIAFGFHNQGSFGLALAIGLGISFAAIGQGLAVACFVANDSQAVNYGSIVTMLQVFVSGAFFPMPAPLIGQIGGHELTLFDLIPATHGMLILQQTLVFGAEWETVAFRFLIMTALSLVYFAGGVIIFAKMPRFRA